MLMRRPISNSNVLVLAESTAHTLTAFEWTQLHRVGTGKAECEDLKASVQRRIVEMLPAIGDFGARIDLRIGP